MSVLGAAWQKSHLTVITQPPSYTLEMIGVQEDLLNIFLATHGLLLLTNLGLALLFSMFLCVRHHPAFKDEFRYLPTSAYNWLNRGAAPEPELKEPVRRRRRRLR